MLHKISVRRTLFMVLYLCRMSQWGLHAVLWLHIGTLMLVLGDPVFDYPVFDGVGLEGFKSRANAILLAYLLAPFLSFIL